MKNLNKMFVSFVMVSVLSGCVWTQEKPDQPEIVYQPVIQYPENFPEVERPELPIENLSIEDKSDFKKVSRAFVISIEKLRKVIDTYEEYAEHYRWTEEERNNTELEEINTEKGNEQ